MADLHYCIAETITCCKAIFLQLKTKKKNNARSFPCAPSLISIINV